ncbi:MAG TPA: DMT family transporter [Burkholderiaceae bacterium]|nr:DMT family transporter [Burkholderiaceae bacterium]
MDQQTTVFWSRGAPLVFLILWSSGFVFLKMGLAYAEPLSFLALRYALVVAVLLPVLLWVRPTWPQQARQWAHLAVVGVLLQAGYFSFTYLSLHHQMSAGGIALITSQQPILVGLLAPLVSSERVSAGRWAGLILGVAGALMVIVARPLGGEGVGALGVLYAILALMVITASTLWEKRFGTESHPVVANLVQYAIGFVVVLPLALWLEDGDIQWHAPGLWLSLAYLVVCNSIVAITLLLAMIRRGEVSRVSALFFLVPPGTALIALVLLAEELPLLGWTGIAVATVGIFLAMRY